MEESHFNFFFPIFLLSPINLASPPYIMAWPAHEPKGQEKSGDFPTSNNNVESSNENCCSDGDYDNNSVGSLKEEKDSNSLGRWKDGTNGWSDLPVSEASASGFHGEWRSGMSWEDRLQEDELAGEEEQEQQELNTRMVNVNDSTGGLRITKVVGKSATLPREQREYTPFMNVKRTKDYICFEKVNGKVTNILQGLELHTGIFSDAEQKRIVDCVYAFQAKGKKGGLKERTYSAPHKWMRSKGRVTLQFGCYYNYATDKNGNPPGILQDEMVDPIPDLFKVMIRRLVRWHVIPPACVPDSCIVNIYEEGDCIPPHIDHHDFVRPFCTVSFLSECNILFGTNLKVVGAGSFDGPIAIPLPVGSVLVLNGNGANVAKHCVPSVPTKRISITFRKMDEAKRPIGFVPAPDFPTNNNYASRENFKKSGQLKEVAAMPAIAMPGVFLPTHPHPLLWQTTVGTKRLASEEFFQYWENKRLNSGHVQDAKRCGYSASQHCIAANLWRI